MPRQTFNPGLICVFEDNAKVAIVYGFKKSLQYSHCSNTVGHEFSKQVTLPFVDAVLGEKSVFS